MLMLKRVSVLLAMLLLALTMGQSAVMAQDDGMDDDPFDFSDAEGIQYAGLRTYSIDYEAMMATPSEDMSMPTGVLAMVGGVVEFDNDDNAEKAFDAASEEALSELAEEEENTTVEEIEIDLGNKSKAVKLETNEDGMALTGAFVLAQEDNYIYIAGVVGSEIDGEALAKDFGQKLIDNDASDDEVVFADDGTSTGGVWDKFPEADDEVLTGLLPISDEQLYPEAED